ncbi:MAG: hypothetical protein ABIG95_03700 [Candidatus Woesearchaeota archaeon]
MALTGLLEEIDKAMSSPGMGREKAESLIARLNRVLEKMPYDVDVLHRRAILYPLCDKWGASALDLEQILALAPERLYLLPDLQAANEKIGKPYEVMDRLWNLMSTHGENPRYWEAKGDVQFRMGMYTAAAESYRRLVSFDPESINAFFQYSAAVVYDPLANKEELAMAYDRLSEIEVEGDSNLVEELIGLAAARLGRWMDAEDIFEALVFGGDENPGVLNNLAVVKQSLGKMGEARGLLERGLANGEYDYLAINLGILSVCSEGIKADGKLELVYPLIPQPL